MELAGQKGSPATGNQRVDVQDETATTFAHGAKSSISTSALQMKAVSIACHKGVLVKAANGNSGIVYVGSSSDVTAGSSDVNDGYELASGEAVMVEVDNVNKVYVIGSASGQKVFWLVV